MRRWFGGGFVLVLAAMGCTPQIGEQVSGILVAGTECVLLQSDDDQMRYVVENLEDFQVGDRVVVRGRISANCVGVCQEGDGCVEGNTIQADDGDYQACGELIDGVECVLFESDEGERYVLDNRSNFEVGDRVRVTGVLRENCVTLCQQGNGCIINNTIQACED